MLIKPTMFDAFVNTMSKSHIARKSARKIVSESASHKAELENVAKEILTSSGVDAKYKVRMKDLDSTAKKITRYLQNDFDTYANKREEIMSIILGKKGIGEIIGDTGGIRFTAEHGDIDKIFSALLNRAKKDKKFAVEVFENYFGKGINPYASQGTVDDFAKLTYKNALGKTKHTAAVNAEKKTGYTRVNIGSQVDDVNTEIQVGGKFTNPWGDKEHPRYDWSIGKNPDMSKVVPEDLPVLEQYGAEYKKLLPNSKKHKQYMKEYMTKIWGALKQSEEKGLSVPEYPAFPSGFPDILKAETLMNVRYV